jgi:chloramphenicol O-acetyltransferase type A
MPHFLDLDSWPRRAHFDFFRRYEHPFWGVCTTVDVTTARNRCERPGGPSFFLLTLHASLVAANQVAEFRQRLRGERVLVHETIHGGSTVLLANDTFVFAYFEFDPDFDLFARRAAGVLDATRAGPGKLAPRPDRDDLLHYSVLPWIPFTSFTHARRHDPEDSVPKIVFGKARTGTGGRWSMPVAIDVHHALVDGLHVGRFLDGFQERLNATA